MPAKLLDYSGCGLRRGVRNTTSHNKEVLQAGGVQQFLTAGHHVLRISLPQDAYQNWNLDYLQLEPVRH